MQRTTPMTRLPLMRHAALAVATLASALAMGTVCAQAKYPARPITLVTPWAVGGANDVLCRITARFMTAEFGVPVNVVNRPGGNLVPGVLSVLKAAPDGYTLLSESPGSGAGMATMKDLPFKWDDRSFGPMFTSSPLAFVVKGDTPWKSLKDVADTVKKNPGGFTWGFLGGTANTDISTIQFLDHAGVEVARTRPVPMAGSGPAVTAIAGGHILFANVGISAAVPLLKAGNLKVMAVTSEQRMAAYPDVPTTREAGFPEVNITTYSAISGPKGLSKEVIDTLDRFAKKLSTNPEYQKELATLANQAFYLSSEDTVKRVRQQADQYRAALAKVENLPK